MAFNEAAFDKWWAEVAKQSVLLPAVVAVWAWEAATLAERERVKQLKESMKETEPIEP